MRERLERMLGPIARAIWILTFHAACGRILRREAQRLGYRSNFTIYDQADQVRLVKQCLEELERDPKRFTPRGIHSVISREKNNLVGPDAVPRARLVVLRPDGRRRVRAVPAQAVRVERRRLRRPALPHRRRARALPRGARALAQGVPLRPRRRVPGHEPRAVPAAAAARVRAPQPLRRRRPRSVDLRVPRRRHPQHPRLRARLPRHADDRARAELPLDELDPARGERASSRTTASASRSTCSRISAKAIRSRRSRSRTSTPRRASSPRASPRSSRRASPAARSRSSTG